MRSRLALVWWSIGLAVVMWGMMFRPSVQQAVNFWVMMPVATTLLGSLTLIARGSVAGRNEFNARNILTGIISAAVLYGIFYAGNAAMNIVAGAFPSLVPDKTAQLQTVYNQGGGVPRAVVGLLLFFPVGCGEELFWRGFVQASFNDQWGRMRGLVMTLIAYTAVHIPTGNLLLILAAFTCGLFWGLLFHATRSVVPGIVSHMLWDPFIFAVAPIV